MKEIFSVFRNSLTAGCMTLLLLLVSGDAFAQNRVTGQVTDQSGQPLTGVTVIAVGTNTGTTTDSQGRYAISVKNGATLEFSFIGMLSERKSVGGGNTALDIVLKEDTAEVDEVVVVGYGTQRKASMTAAVSQIQGDDLLKAPISNISQGLAGRLPGLSSVQNSGQPGADQATLNIRNSRSGILYIVDGVPRSISDIDPNDVESVSLLKDGAASAVYGLNAAGGVMIVTTKKGRQGRSTVTYRGSVGASMNTSYPEFLDGPGYAYWYNRALELDGKQPIFTRKQVDMMLNDDSSDGWGNTNWFDEVFGTGIIQQHSITSTGGNDKINYFASLGYLGQDGNIENFEYDRYNLRTNIEAKIANGVTFTLGVAGQIGDNKSPGYAAGGTSGTAVASGNQPWLSIAEQAAFAHPYIPMEYEGMPTASLNGYQNTINPVAATELSGRNKSQTIALQTNAALQWDLPWVPGLSVKAMGSYDRSATTAKNLSTPYYVMLAATPDSNTDHITYKKALDARNTPSVGLTEGYTQWQRITSQLSLNYSFEKSGHKVEALALLETRDYKTNKFGARGKDLSIPELPELTGNGVQPATNPIYGSSNANRAVGFVFRANYAYQNRYMLEFSGRYDGSYKFIGNISGKRWGFFPSVSAGWRISEEKFFASARKVVDNLKIRASFGTTGSDSGSSAYAFLSTFNPQFSYPSVVIGGTGLNGLQTSVVANEMLTWERQHSYNIGFDLSMWQGKLGLEVDAFYNYTFDILAPSTGYPPSMGGYYPSYVNNNAQDVRGIDVKISHRNQVGKFSYGVVLNMSYAKDRWLRYEDQPNTPDYARHVGHSRSMSMGFIADGLFQSEEEIDNSPFLAGERPRVGDIKYRDLNGDGQITYEQDRAYIGRGQRPQFTGSLNLFGSWKGIDVDLLFVGAAICDVSLTGTYYNWNEDHTIFTKPFKAGANAPRYLVENAWTPEHPDADYPRLSIDAPNTNNAYASSFWYRDGKYLRLKSASIGYTFPKTWMNKIGLGKLRVYVEGTNLFTVSGLPEGIDPEWPGVSNGYYPQQRTVVGGLELTF